MSRSVLVLGLGNTLLCDEGAGVHVIRYLQEHHSDIPDVEYLDGGTLSFALAGPIEDVDGLIVIDAAELGAEAGAIRCFQNQAMDTFVGSNRKRSVHEVSLLDLLAVAYLSDRLPARRALIGIQPHTVDWSDRPTEKIAEAIPQAGRQVLDILQEWRQ
ncbi:MAG: HyaD/HybD family hydrogenase maturation endopeptidase [Gammaproteobacteria bacterium]|nr:HyaD/HybD family hydrogenase maturation endopeptidase [Gammaproteobacteria bacterium]